LRVARETCMDEAQRKAGEDNHGECTLGISPIVILAAPWLLEFRARNSTVSGNPLQPRRELQQFLNLILQAFIRLQSYN
jgi:hypothetical protein